MIPIFIDILGAYFIAKRYSSWSKIIPFAALLGAVSTLIEQISIWFLVPVSLTGTQIAKLSVASFFLHSGIALAAASIFRLFIARSQNKARSRDDSTLR